MNTLSATYNKIAQRHASLDRLELSDGRSITVGHQSLSHDCLPKFCYRNIIADEQDVSCDNPDCFWEPPIVFDKDAEDAYKQWKEGFEYFITNGSGIEPMD